MTWRTDQHPCTECGKAHKGESTCVCNGCGAENTRGHPVDITHGSGEGSWASYETEHGCSLRCALLVISRVDSIHFKTVRVEIEALPVDQAAAWLEMLPSVRPRPAPKWDLAHRTHDWRNHVPQELRDIWHTLTPKQEEVLVLVAGDLADAEEWD